MRFNKLLYSLPLVMLFLSFSHSLQAQASKPVTNNSEDSVQSQSTLTIEQRIFALQKELSDVKYQLSILQDKMNSFSKTNAPDNSRTKVTTSQNPTSTSPPTNNKPSDDEIKTALIIMFKKEVPPTWAGSLLGGTNGTVSSIEIQQFGNYNEQSKYWPIKIRVKGSCDAEMLMSKERRSFDKVGDFKLQQDDYGKWTASLEGF